MKDKDIDTSISNLSSGFLENSLWHASKSIDTYAKNCKGQRNSVGHRNLIAFRENRHAASVMLNAYTALEFLLTTESFHQKLNDFDSDDNAVHKAKKVGITSEALLNAIEEFSIPRDTLSHAHLWKTQRIWDETDYTIVKVTDEMWEEFSKKLRNKFSSNVDIKNGVTKNYKFSIIPDKIDFLDVVKSIYLVNLVYTLLLTSSNTSWRPGFFPYLQDGFPKDVSSALSKRFLLDDWVAFLISKLCTQDSEELKFFINKLS